MWECSVAPSPISIIVCHPVCVCMHFVFCSFLLVHFSRRPPQRVRGTVGPTDVALCRRYIWVTTQSAALQPPSFSPLSAPIPACVHSTRLMVCVIHSDCLTTSHLFALPESACVCAVCLPFVCVCDMRECIEKKNKERKGEREER